MSVTGRQELIEAIRDRYKRATRKEKTKILDELVQATGLNRKYAITALVDCESRCSVGNRAGRPRYSKEISAALETLWEASNRLCSKRLVAVMPRLIEAMEQQCPFGNSA
jgi:hypothetical protein